MIAAGSGSKRQQSFFQKPHDTHLLDSRPLRGAFDSCLTDSVEVGFETSVRIEVFLNGWASAHQVAIAVGLVNAANCRPDLASEGDPLRRVSCFLTTVVVLPFVGCQVAQGVGSVFEYVCSLVDFSLLDFSNFCSNQLHRLDEPV